MCSLVKEEHAIHLENYQNELCWHNVTCELSECLIPLHDWQEPRKRHLKSEFALPRTLKGLFHLVQFAQFVKCWQIVLELNSKGLCQSTGKEKESLCLLFTSSSRSEVRYFRVVVVQWRQEIYKKAWCTYKVVVLLIQTYCFCAILVVLAVVVV